MKNKLLKLYIAIIILIGISNIILRFYFTNLINVYYGIISLLIFLILKLVKDFKIKNNKNKNKELC